MVIRVLKTSAIMCCLFAATCLADFHVVDGPPTGEVFEDLGGEPPEPDDTVLAATVFNLQGHGRGTVMRNMLVRDFPLLKHFFFQFRHKDKHILRIGILGSARSTFIFEDVDTLDRYFYNISFVDAIGGRKRPGNAFGVSTNGDEAVIPIDFFSDEVVFVLRGFRLSFRETASINQDRHIDMVSIYERNGDLHVRMKDKNGDDWFQYSIDYSLINRESIVAQGLVSGTSAKGAAAGNSMNGMSVISGFHVDFQSKDHHLRDIGVMAKDGTIEVFFEDKNGDDKFDWFVKYAILKTEP